MRGVRVLEDPVLARRADPDLLSLALMDSRNRTLRWLSVFEAGGAWAANPDAAHPVAPWRCIGRAGWFQEQWIARHVQRRRGEAADPDAPRLPSLCLYGVIAAQRCCHIGNQYPQADAQ